MSSFPNRKQMKVCQTCLSTICPVRVSDTIQNKILKLRQTGQNSMGDSSHPSEGRYGCSEGHPEEKPYLPELGWEECHSFSSRISSSVN